MRTCVVGLCLLTASLGLGATAAAQSTDPAAGHAGHAGMQGMPTTDVSAVPMAGAGSTSALLTGPLGTRSPTGTVTVDGRTVRVAWSGDQPGSTRPWYIHRGSCGRDEGVVGAPSAYRPIAVDARGTGTGTATLPEPLPPSGTYYVAVHSGVAGPPADVLACGALGGGMGGGQMNQMAGMPGMNASSGQPAAHDMVGMDHSTMDHSTMNMSGGMATPGTSPARGSGTMSMGPSMMRGAPPAAGATGMSSRTMMADHMRMMADHMQMMADHMRMMAQMPAEGGAMTTPPAGGRTRTSGTAAQRPARPSAVRPRPSAAAGGHDGHAGMNMPGMAAPAVGARATPRQATPTAPATRPAAPAPKRDSMPGMDHSKMPGMGRP